MDEILYLEGDSNPHIVADTWFWVKRVYQFRHQGLLTIMRCKFKTKILDFKANVMKLIKKTKIYF